MGRPVVTPAPSHDCVYVTSGWGIHDDRWMNALRSVGFTPIAISLDEAARGAADLRSDVEAATRGTLPVLAGPLHSVTRQLVGVTAPVIGLSWGYDFDELANAGDISWLSGLDGLVVDSWANSTAAIEYGVAESRITFLPWGIDLDQFPTGGPQIDPEDLDLPNDAKLLVSLRAHESLYRVGDIIDAFIRVSNAVPEAALVIGHEGALTDSFRATVRESGLGTRVRFIGMLPEPDLAPLLRGATAYITASQADGPIRFDQGHIFNEQGQHTLTTQRTYSLVIPRPREVVGQLPNAGTRFVA